MDMLTGTVELTERELIIIRQSLDIIQIYGKDAPFVAGLMYKIEEEIRQMHLALQLAEEQKAAALREAVAQDKNNQQTKRSK
jgi:hypothetical protein